MSEPVATPVKSGGYTGVKTSSPDRLSSSSMEMEDDNETFKGEQQPPMYRDKWFAVVFCIQLIGVVLTALILGSSALLAENGNGDANRRTLQASSTSSFDSTGNSYSYNDPSSSSGYMGAFYEPYAPQVSSSNSFNSFGTSGSTATTYGGKDTATTSNSFGSSGSTNGGLDTATTSNSFNSFGSNGSGTTTYGGLGTTTMTYGGLDTATTPNSFNSFGSSGSTYGDLNTATTSNSYGTSGSTNGGWNTATTSNSFGSSGATNGGVNTATTSNSFNSFESSESSTTTLGGSTTNYTDTNHTSASESDRTNSSFFNAGDTSYPIYSSQDEADDVDITAVWVLVSVTSIAVLVFTMIGLRFMVMFSHKIVHISFFAAPVCFGVVALWIFAVGGDDMAGFFSIWAVAVSLLSLCCYGCLRRYIPFAASNLNSALSAIGAHKGLYLMALGTLLAIYAWTGLWILAMVGVFYNASKQDPVPCSDDLSETCEATPNVFGIIVLILCFYWTQQVLQNVLHVTTAGTVGAWWFSPMKHPQLNRGMCSREVSDSFSRATTYSLGSICFGSLLVAIVQTLESIARNARHHGRGGILLCVVQCLLMCLRQWMHYFNSWAFVYVGLYGYDYLTAGKNVMQLFQHVGWTTIITDRLVYRVLFLMNLSIGALAGGVAVAMDAAWPAFGDDQHIAAFFVGFLLGIILSGTALFVVESAVRSVIVCFAESPNEFRRNHPDLCQDMQSGWAKTYPTAFGDNQGREGDEGTPVTRVLT